MENLLGQEREYTCIVLGNSDHPDKLLKFLDYQEISWVALPNLRDLVITWSDWLRLRDYIVHTNDFHVNIEEIVVISGALGLKRYPIKNPLPTTNRDLPKHLWSRNLEMMPLGRIFVDLCRKEIIAVSKVSPPEINIIAWVNHKGEVDLLDSSLYQVENLSSFRRDLRRLYLRNILPELDEVIPVLLKDVSAWND